MTDFWEENSLAPLEGNDPYMDRVMANNLHVTKLMQEGTAKEIARLKQENAAIKLEKKEAEHILKENMKEFNENKNKLEKQYQDAVTELNRLKFRVNEMNDGKEEMEKTIETLTEKLRNALQENQALQDNLTQFELFLENENEDDTEEEDKEEKKAEQEVQKWQKINQQVLEAQIDAQDRLADKQKQRAKKKEAARKRMSMLKQMRNSKTRHGGLSSNGAAYIDASLPAFDDGLEAEGNSDPAARPQHQRRESGRSMDLQEHEVQHDPFVDHHLADIEGGEFDFDHDEENSFEHTCITPSPIKGKREVHEPDDNDSEEEKLTDSDEEMSDKPATTKVATEKTKKTKTGKRRRAARSIRERREEAYKQRKKFKGKPIEKWSREALKAECLYKKQKGDKGVPEKKSALFEIFKVRHLRPSPPNSDAEECDEKKMEEREEQVECKDDDDIEDESASDDDKAGDDDTEDEEFNPEHEG
jgi:hypothetical protein